MIPHHMGAQAIEYLRHSIATNQFFAGGFLLGMLTGIVYWLKGLPWQVWRWFNSQLFIEVTVDERDEIFGWLTKWLAELPYGQRRARSLMAITDRRREGIDDGYGNANVPMDKGADGGVRRQPSFYLTPARGRHWFIYRRTLVVMSRGNNEATPPKNDAAQGIRAMLIPETLTLRMLTRDRGLIRALIEEARELAYPKDEQRTAIFAASWGREWLLVNRRRPRPLATVIIKAGIAEQCMTAMRDFRARERWYAEHGIPYRLGIELEGPPGSGKTSLVTAMAAHFGMNVASINLGAETLDDEGLGRLLSKPPRDSLVLIEDIDGVFRGRERVGQTHNKLTFSGLLNAIDGVAAGDGRILFVTTNHHSALDPALVRRGRIDYRFMVGAPDAEQAARMFMRFFPGSPAQWGVQFAAALGDLNDLAMADIQGLLIEHQGSALRAIEAARTRSAVEPEAAAAG